MRNDPLAYFLTWTTYGTWLPGDDRGSFAKTARFRNGARNLEGHARRSMREPAVTLGTRERDLCEKTILRVAAIREWKVWAVAVRSNHVHVVVTAAKSPPKTMADLKSWCTRDLRAAVDPERENWWTERGSYRLLFDEEGMDAAVRYVTEAQDRKDRET